MNLEDVKITIRPRRDWEAVDLGLLMGRHWWQPMMRAWVTLTFPVVLALSLVPSHWLWLSSLILWWLKPVFERPLLMILSQGVFGAQPTNTQVVRAFPRLALRQCVASLTWRRLSPSRAMDLPVLQLEGLRGAERSDRLTVLHRDDAGPAGWLTIIGVHIEAAIGLAMFLLAAYLIPEELTLSWLELDFGQANHAGLLAQFWAYYASISLVVPWYVACGFSLYLNRRVKLEGWDIEIAFKRMVMKRTPGGAVASAWLLGVMVTALMSFSAERVHAQPASDNPQFWHEAKAESKADIEAVMEDPVFHRTQTIRRVKTEDENPEQEETSWRLDSLPILKHIASFFEGFANVIQAIAFGGELLLWGLVLGIIVFLAFRYRHWLAALRPQTKFHPPTAKRPQTLFGLDLRPESLPENIAEAAWQLWRQGDQRGALALLYRASLAEMLRGGVTITEASTEAQCLERLRSHLAHTERRGVITQYFAQLTQQWQLIAYGHQTPITDTVHELCRQWPVIWHSSDSSADEMVAGGPV